MKRAMRTTLAAFKPDHTAGAQRCRSLTPMRKLTQLSATLTSPAAFPDVTASFFGTNAPSDRGCEPRLFFHKSREARQEIGTLGPYIHASTAPGEVHARARQEAAVSSIEGRHFK